MENTKIRAIKKSAGVAATVLNVLRIVALVGAIIAFMGGFFCLVGKGIGNAPIYENGKLKVYLPGQNAEEAIDFYIDDEPEFLEDLPVKDVLVASALKCFFASVMMAGTMVILLIIRNMFLEIRDSDTPFTEEIRRRLKVAGILVTVLAALESVGIAAVVALAMWCAYSIFGYGMELQKRDDETL